MCFYSRITSLRNDHRTCSPKYFSTVKKKKENSTLRATKDTTARGTGATAKGGAAVATSKTHSRSLPTRQTRRSPDSWTSPPPRSASSTTSSHAHALGRPFADALAAPPLRRRDAREGRPVWGRRRIYLISVYLYFFIFSCLFFFVLFPLLAHSPAPASPLRVHMQYTYIILVSLSWWNISVFLMQSAFQEEAGNSCFFSRHRFPWWISGIEWVRWPGYAWAVWWAGGVWIL